MLVLSDRDGGGAGGARRLGHEPRAGPRQCDAQHPGHIPEPGAAGGFQFRVLSVIMLGFIKKRHRGAPGLDTEPPIARTWTPAALPHAGRCKRLALCQGRNLANRTRTAQPVCRWHGGLKQQF